MTHARNDAGPDAGGDPGTQPDAGGQPPALPEFASLDDVPEAFRSLYREDGDRVVPAVQFADGDGGEEADRIAAALAAERKQRRALEAKLREAEQERRRRRTKDTAGASGLSDADLERIRKEVAEEYADELEQGRAARTRLEELERDTAIREALIASGVERKRLSRAARLLRDEVERTAEGTIVPRERPALALSDYVAKHFRAEWPEMFEADGAEGAAGAGERGNVTAPSGDNPFAWSDAQKEAYRTAHGIGKYEELVASAIARGLHKRKGTDAVRSALS